MPELLKVEDARIDEGGAPVVDGLTFATGKETRRLLVLGAPRALFEGVAGIREPVRGSVRIAGDGARARLLRGGLAAAAMEAPLPPWLTTMAYVTWSARLAGHGRREARGRAAEALVALRLTPFAQARLDKIGLAARRATALAAALATGAEVLVVEDPLTGLGEPEATALALAMAEVLGSRSFVYFAGRASLGVPPSTLCDEAVVLAGSVVVAQGPPQDLAAAPRRYALQVRGDRTSLASRLMERGATVAADGDRLMVTLPEGLGTSQVLALALEAQALVMELRPLARTFA